MPARSGRAGEAAEPRPEDSVPPDYFAGRDATPGGTIVG
jgi:hypothetical protein